MVPSIAIGPGYEWYRPKLSDESGESSRSYGGPLWFATELFAAFPLGRRVTWGPAFDVGVGTFTHLTVSGPGLSSSGFIEGRAVHGWVSLGLRTAISL
jgi:hypothetical protein